MPLILQQMTVVFCYAALAISTVLFTLSTRMFLQILQQEGYRTRDFLKWTFANTEKAFSPSGWFFLGTFTVLFLFEMMLLNAAINEFIFSIAVLAAAVIPYLFLVKMMKLKNAKQPLKYTGRVKRLIVAVAVLGALIVALPYACTPALTSPWLLLVAVLLVLQPFVVALANLIMTPFENINKKRYFNEAAKKLDARKDLIKIGITGSYGKTSTKFILGTILSEKYETLIPPSSYNTPMGLTKVIREELTDSHKAFVAEMGARHVGDIAELCRLVHPQYGIITAIGPQHLETFKKIENVEKTKYELIEALPKDGKAFFNADDEACVKLYEKTDKTKYLYGIQSDREDLFVRAENLETGEFGSRFTLKFAGEEQGIEVSTRMLGRHNVLNITACAAIAKVIGLTNDEIKEGIAKVQPVEHRLCILPGENGITVIDDAFNSNPKGARMALETLASFDGRKFVITPGMVELGEIEEEENYNFGVMMANTVDFALLVGKKRSEPILEGLKDGGFDMNNARVFHTLNEATQAFGEMSRPGDVVIFENDLPDNYTE